MLANLLRNCNIHSKQYRLFRRNPSVLLPCNRVFLGLHGNSTDGFFLKDLYCLECTING